MTDAPKTIEHPVGEGEVADDPPFATPMEAPEAATLGKTKNMGTAEEFTKTA